MTIPTENDHRLLQLLKRDHQEKLAAYLKHASRCQPLIDLLYKHPTRASLAIDSFAAIHTWHDACQRLRAAPDLFGELAQPTPSYVATALRIAGLSPSVPYRPKTIAKQLSAAILGTRETLPEEKAAAERLKQFQLQYPDLQATQHQNPSRAPQLWNSLTQGLPCERPASAKQRLKLVADNTQQQSEEEPDII